MRTIVYGAGAVGTVIGVRLHQRGHDVTLIARGENYVALKRSGARLDTPKETLTEHVDVVDSPSRIDFRPTDVVMLCMKSQDTRDALLELSSLCEPSTPIFCAQNGVENERSALRHFQNVYGMYVMCQAIHLTPGVVRIPSSPLSGILDIGRWPVGSDQAAIEVSQVLNDATFDSQVRDDISRWKWGKLIRNLGNAVEAVCGSQARGGALVARAVQEGVDVLNGAGIPFSSAADNLSRREGVLTIASHDFGGGSTWQSLSRRSGSVETDFLTGEIVLQGRLCRVPTPVNVTLQRLANQMAREGLLPGHWSEDEVFELL